MSTSIKQHADKFVKFHDINPNMAEAVHLVEMQAKKIQHLESLLEAIVEARAECLNKRSLDADSKLFDAIKAAADYLRGDEDG